MRQTEGKKSGLESRSEKSAPVRPGCLGIASTEIEKTAAAGGKRVAIQDGREIEAAKLRPRN
jgi:hypothetical protein